MLAICKGRFGNSIPPKERHLEEVDDTDYSLKIGEKYPVYGLMFIRDRVDYLVSPAGEMPSWVPHSLFDLADSRLPEGWVFSATQLAPGYRELLGVFGVNYLVGYPLLVNDYSHYVGLLGRDPEQMQLFLDHRIGLE